MLGGHIGEQMIFGRDLLRHGVVALQGQGDGDGPVRAGGEGAHLAALRVVDGEHCPLQGKFGPLLQFHDLQRRLTGRGIVPTGVTADGGQFHLTVVVQIADIILEFAIFVLFLADGVHGRVLGNGCGEGELDVPALALDAASGIDDLELAGVAVPGGLCGDGVDLPVVQVHDLRPDGDGAGVGKGHRHIVVVHPGLAPDREHLLEVVLAADGHGVGGGAVRGDGHPGFQHIVIGGAPLVDVLGGGQDAVANVQLAPGQAGGHLQVGDVPVGQQVAPQGHLGGVVGLVLVVQLQLPQGAVGIAVGDDAHHLGVAGLFLRQILDALAGAYGLWDTLGIGIYAVGRGLLLLAVIPLIEEIGVFLFPDRAVDGQIAQLIVAVVDVHFAQGRVLTGGRHGGGEQTQQRQHGQENRQQPFLHVGQFLLLRKNSGPRHRSVCRGPPCLVFIGFAGMPGSPGSR